MDNLVSSPTIHSHGPIPDAVPVIELKNQIKTRAATTDEQTSAILHSALRTFPLYSAIGHEGYVYTLERTTETKLLQMQGSKL